ncbi:transporter substrate-binding domain-containing protein [Phenylobacterium sp. J426]|uniref:transporter substrate-binding domain-containing protein n=1 Tax=Phenylobacterium sp. J426 TaxID=2898439 RepID=UPI002150DAA5|nr:transporter substrate-binding domain-containing protein [Phenylobacterium sp. J426]
MIRLALTAAMALLLAGCDSRPAPEPEPKAPPVKATTAAPDYAASESPTLKAVRARGYLACGVHPALPGFAFKDARGDWRGFDVDICRALAAAVLGDATKVRFTPIDGGDRFAALKAGRIDVLSRNTSLTLSRDAGLGLTFPVTTYFDGQGFLGAAGAGPFQRGRTERRPHLYPGGVGQRGEPGRLLPCPGDALPARRGGDRGRGAGAL